ncbi:MAG: hypothetical protein IH617_14205, partial [Hydrogenophaga sp.]|nr:hypothetical protein [Hydrogenophaga sp.]
AMRYVDGKIVMEILIPNAVLGDVISAGEVWPLTINAKTAAALSPRTRAVWPAGPEGGHAGWGRVMFVD